MTGPEHSDEALLRAHVAGDPDAFAELLRRHQDRLWAVAIRTIGDREEAADALQDALLSAHRAAGRFRGDSAVTTWLHRIVVNSCLDRIRRRQTHRTVPLPDGSFDVDTDGRRTGGPELAAPAPDHDTALVVRQALARLPAEQRVALILVDVQGYSVAEASKIMQVAEGTVKSRCARGRARLAMALGHLRADAVANRPASQASPTPNVPSPNATRSGTSKSGTSKSGTSKSNESGPDSSEPDVSRRDSSGLAGNPSAGGSVPLRLGLSECGQSAVRADTELEEWA